MRFAEHLGDGAYIHLTDFGEVVLTANHHEPAQASDTVTLDGYAVDALRRWLKNTETQLTLEKGAK